LNRRILASKQPDEVLDLCREHLPQFDIVNLPTALQCLARMAPDQSDASFGLLLQSVLATLPQFTPQGLANVA